MKEKAYKYRFFPTPEQKQQLAQTFGCARYVYNWGIEQKTQAWHQKQESLNYVELANLLPALKVDKEFLADVSSVVLQQSIRNLSTAFTNFFEGRAKYPTFKSRKSRQSVRYAKNGFTLKDQTLTLAKQSDPLDISWSQPLPDDAELISATVSKDSAERYFISILVRTDIQPLPVAEKEVGIDVGLATLATLSDGQKIDNPRHLVSAEKRLRRAQRSVSRKAKGGKNRAKAKLKLAKLHAKVADTRSDFAHKFTTDTIRDNQAVYVEDLNVEGMKRNHNLARHISDAAWSEMFRQLKYKAEWYGRTYVEIDRFFPSSKLCSSCSHLPDSLPLSVRQWDCPSCQAHHDRDINAAINIKVAGQYLLNTRSDAGESTPKRKERRRSA